MPIGPRGFCCAGAVGADCLQGWMIQLGVDSEVSTLKSIDSKQQDCHGSSSDTAAHESIISSDLDPGVSCFWSLTIVALAELSRHCSFFSFDWSLDHERNARAGSGDIILAGLGCITVLSTPVPSTFPRAPSLDPFSASPHPPSALDQVSTNRK
jgi:hypothetical protein